ncbi:uncharacterized protein [Typha latifolia]|uniref:uncharacterized protein n=1 Tax=Typha latifolia TaxID=4733 RepID=UPI003C2EF7CC
MKAIAWNCRGCEGVSKIHNLRQILCSTLSSLAFISETRCDTSRSSSVISSLPLSCSFVVPANNRAGSLWMLWNDSITITVKGSSQHFIAVEVLEPSATLPWLFIGVYGDPTDQCTAFIWSLITNIIQDSLTSLVVCVGDFNEIACVIEKLGGLAPNCPRYQAFADWIHSVGLVNLDFDGLGYTCFSANIHRFNSKLKSWAHNHSLNPSFKLKKIEQQIITLQAISNPSAVDLAHENALRSVHEELICRKEIYWHQRSRQTWLAAGDRSIAFFHTSASVRRRRNLISSHFGFSPPTDDEITKVLMHFGPDKAPGYDGINAHFLQSQWTTFKPEICQEVRRFFISSSMDRNLNKTIIILIPKKPALMSVGDFKPISLCSIVYKLISKILANKLKPLLNDIISKTQNAFIPGRQVIDNHILVQEVMTYMKSSGSTSRSFLFKADLSKAFDHMEWFYLCDVLALHGFWTKFINLINQCISTTSFTVDINGSKGGFFTPSRGLHQGCPLSPYLFILGANLLSLLLDQGLPFKKIVGLKLARPAPAITIIIAHSWVKHSILTSLLFTLPPQVFHPTVKICCSYLLLIILQTNVLLLQSSPVVKALGSSETDRRALLAFKAAITHDPHGFLRSWNVTVPFCQWPGVACRGQNKGRMTSLVLESKGLEGPLSPSIGNFTFLTVLRLPGNTLSGTIPPPVRPAKKPLSP